MLSLGTAKARNPRKFSLWQLYFSPICENFLPRKFSAIRYAILTKCITSYYHIWKYNYLFTRKWKYSCPVQLKGNMSYMCVDCVEYRKCMLFYKLYSHIWNTFLCLQGSENTAVLFNWRGIFMSYCTHVVTMSSTGNVYCSTNWIGR